MHICLVNQAGEVLVHRNLPTHPDRFLNAIAPYRHQDLVVAVECMFTWYNLPPITKKLTYAANRQNLAQQFTDRSARLNVEADLELIDHFDDQLRRLELQLSRTAKVDNPQDYYLLRGIPGVGKILALVLLYEIHDIRRFPKAGNFLSYARLVKCAHESAGKRLGSGGKEIGGRPFEVGLQ